MMIKVLNNIFSFRTLQLTTSDYTSIIKKLFLVMVLTLIVCEICLQIKNVGVKPRWFVDGRPAKGEHFFRDISIIPWALKPNLNTLIEDTLHGDKAYRLITDEYGHRVLPASPDKGKLVFLLGDSFTMGAFLESEMTFGNLIAKGLADKGYRTINTGVPNYGPPEYVKTLIEEIKKNGPQQIESAIIFFNISTDFSDFEQSFWEGKKHNSLPIEVPVKNYFTNVNQDGDLRYLKYPLMDVLKIIPYLHYRIYNPAKSEILRIPKKLNRGEKPSLVFFLNNFHEYCQQKRINLYIIIVCAKPVKGQVPYNHDLSPLKSVKIPIHDFTKTINAKQGAGEELFLNDRSHLNEKGSKLLADETIKFVLREK